MQQQMDLRQYVRIIRKWFWLLIVGVGLAGGGSYYVSIQMPKVYEASTTLLVQQASPNMVAQYNDIITSQSLAKTYSQLLTKRPVLQAVIANLKLTTTPDELEKQLRVELVRDTQLIQVTAANHDPSLAKLIADEVAAVFIARTKETQLGTLASSKQELSNQIDQLNKNITTTQAEIDRLKETNGSDMAITQLQNDLSQYQLTYSSLVKNYQDIQSVEMQAGNSISIAEPAEVPARPTSPQVLRNTLIAAVLGLILALAAPFLIEYLDDTLKTREDVAKALSLPFLGGLLHLKPEGRSKGMLTDRNCQKSPAAEAYRLLRTNIQFSSLDRPVSTILVTSPNPQEGKTTTAINLAVVMALAGKQVMLVDADLRRPGLHKQFGVPNDHGLTTLLLVDHPDLRKAVFSTKVQNLTLVPSGPIPPTPSEIFGSARMEGVIRYLKSQADVIIFDSPPVLGMADASVLATRVDGTLLVMDYGKTRRQAAIKAVEMLRQVGATVLGVAINRLADRTEDYYYYGYYYRDVSEDGNENGAGFEATKKKPTRQNEKPTSVCEPVFRMD